MNSLESITKTYADKIDNKKSNKSTNKNISYDDGLVDALEKDHDELINLYEKILKAAKNHEYIHVEFLLLDFANVFTKHIQDEDQLLYGYLKLLASKKSQLEQNIIADFSIEMTNISVSIFNFLMKSPFLPLQENTLDELLKEYEKIGLLLQDRISREEKILYPIYKNNRNITDFSHK